MPRRKKKDKTKEFWNNFHDVFKHTRHEERKKERLKWKDADLDA